MKISNILAKKGMQVYTVGPKQTVQAAAQLLVQHRIGALVVLDDAGELAGILSERDIVSAIARDEDVHTQTVEQAMTTGVITASPHDDVISVERTMTERRFRHVPIKDEDGQLIGIISIGDVVKAQVDQYQGEIDTLQTQITQG